MSEKSHISKKDVYNQKIGRIIKSLKILGKIYELQEEVAKKGKEIMIRKKLLINKLKKDISVGQTDLSNIAKELKNLGFIDIIDRAKTQERDTEGGKKTYYVILPRGISFYERFNKLCDEFEEMAQYFDKYELEMPDKNILQKFDELGIVCQDEDGNTITYYYTITYEPKGVAPIRKLMKVNLRAQIVKRDFVDKLAERIESKISSTARVIKPNCNIRKSIEYPGDLRSTFKLKFYGIPSEFSDLDPIFKSLHLKDSFKVDKYGENLIIEFKEGIVGVIKDVMSEYKPEIDENMNLILSKPIKEFEKPIRGFENDI